MTNPGAMPSIAVRLTLFADLRRFLPKGHEGPLTVTLPQGATVADLVREAKVDTCAELTVGINGDQGSCDSVLNDGDEVVLFSPMEGG